MYAFNALFATCDIVHYCPTEIIKLLCSEEYVQTVTLSLIFLNLSKLLSDQQLDIYIISIKMQIKLMFFRCSQCIINFILQMEQVEQSRRPKTGISSQDDKTIEAMYSTSMKYYEWENMRYKVPKIYHNTFNPNKGIKSPTKNKTYLDQICNVKKYIPAPNHYKIIEQLPGQKNIINKTERITLTMAQARSSKKENIPGPAHYFQNITKTDNTDRNCMITPKDIQRQHYLNEVFYMASENPGVGEYNIQIPRKIPGPKFVNNSQKILKGSKKIQSVERPSSAISGTFQWIAGQKKIKNSNFFGKDKRFIVGSKYQKKPSPNSYKLNTKWTDSTSLMKKTCSTSRLTWKNNVYYG